jgi:hypothetical protein
VDRASRYTILLHLPGRHTAEAVRGALIAAFCQLPPQLRRSLTWDQGKEMALHAEVAAALGMRCTSATRPARGSGPATRTPTGCSARLVLFVALLMKRSCAVSAAHRDKKLVCAIRMSDVG